MADKLDKESAEVLSVLAYLYQVHGKDEKALNILKVLKDFNPEDAHTARALAFAYYKAGDFQSALQQAEQSLRDEKQPQNLKVASTLIKSKALWGLGREEAARHTINQLVKPQ